MSCTIGTFALLGAGGDFLAKTLPKDLENLAITQPAKLAQKLNDEVQQTLIGAKYIPTAIEDGIIPKGNISVPSPGEIGSVKASELSLSRATQKGEFDPINNYLAKTNEVFGNIKKQVDDILDKAPNVDMETIGTEGRNLMQKILGFKDKAGKGEQIYDDITKELPNIDNYKDVPLKLVNQMKSALGVYYDKIPGGNEVYNQFKNFVAEKSGQPELVNSLNEHYQQLFGIRDNLKFADNVKIPLEKLTTQGIQDAIDKAGKGAPESLKTLAGWMAIAGMGAVGKVVGGTEGMVFGGLLGGAATQGSVGMTMGIRSGISRVIDSMVSSPESKLELMNGLKAVFNNSNKYIKQAIITALKQITIRTPQAFDNQPAPAPAPTIR